MLRVLLCNQLCKTLGAQAAIQYLYLLNESNFRIRFPACTDQVRTKMQAMTAADKPDEVMLEDAADCDPVAKEAWEIGEVETVTAIIDIKGVGLMSFWKLKDLLGQVISISDANYPETANRLFIINAPALFSTAWTYIKSLIDVRTASRVFILGTDYKQALLEHIAPENLPVYLGGMCECESVEGGCRNGDVGCWNEYKGVPW